MRLLLAALLLTTGCAMNQAKPEREAAYEHPDGKLYQIPM